MDTMIWALFLLVGATAVAAAYRVGYLSGYDEGVKDKEEIGKGIEDVQEG